MSNDAFVMGNGFLSRRSFLHIAGATAATSAWGIGMGTAEAWAAGVARPQDLPNGTSRKKVLIFAIDGVRRDKIDAGVVPVLSALARTGQLSYTRTHRPQPKTLSGPGHANILTGTWPAKHRVRDNRLDGHNLSRYPDFLTRLRAVRPRLSTFAISDWGGLITSLVRRPDVKVHVPGRNGSPETTQQITSWVVSAVRDHNPDVGYIHYLMPDTVGHAHGGKSVQYAGAVTRIDREIGLILANVRARPTYLLEDWLILVTTDHGHLANGGHGGSQPAVRNIWTIAAGGYVPRLEPGTGKARMVDLVPTAFHHLGLPQRRAWRLDGRRIPG